MISDSQNLSAITYQLSLIPKSQAVSFFSSEDSQIPSSLATGDETASSPSMRIFSTSSMTFPITSNGQSPTIFVTASALSGEKVITTRDGDSPKSSASAEKTFAFRSIAHDGSRASDEKHDSAIRPQGRRPNSHERSQNISSASSAGVSWTLFLRTDQAAEPVRFRSNHSASGRAPSEHILTEDRRVLRQAGRHIPSFLKPWVIIRVSSSSRPCRSSASAEFAALGLVIERHVTRTTGVSKTLQASAMPSIRTENDRITSGRPAKKS